MPTLFLIIVALIVGLFVVLGNAFQTAQPIQVAGSVAVVVVPTPGAFIGPPSNLIEAAQQWLGVPYLWGGCTHRGVDCSCFVQNVLRVVGIEAPRTTVTQIAWATPIPLASAGLGDLLFFNNTCTDCGANPTHVGLYLGGGMMIDAGDPVKIESIDTPYWRTRFRSAGRPRGL